MAWRRYKSPSNDLWHMLFQYSIERTDILTNRNSFTKSKKISKVHLLKFSAKHVLLLHDLATIVTLVPGP